MYYLPLIPPYAVTIIMKIKYPVFTYIIRQRKGKLSHTQRGGKNAPHTHIKENEGWTDKYRRKRRKGKGKNTCLYL